VHWPKTAPARMRAQARTSLRLRVPWARRLRRLWTAILFATVTASALTLTAAALTAALAASALASAALANTFDAAALAATLIPPSVTASQAYFDPEHILGFRLL
jgi:hypothetical protein